MQQQLQQRQRRTNAADSARAARLLATDLLGALSMLLVHTAICLRLGSAGEGSGGPSWVQALGPTAQTPATSLLFRAAQARAVAALGCTG